MNSQTLRALTREITTLQRTPPEGVRVRIDERNLFEGGIEGIIEGPKDTPFENGFFRVRFDFTDVDFPNMPPKCTMLTKIFHPNISKAGEICVDTLKKGWQRNYGIGHVLVTIKCLLIVPNPESALNEEAGKLFMEGYSDYHRMAKLLTSVHATPKQIPAEFASTLPGSSASPASASKKTSTAASSQPPPQASSSKTATHDSPALVFSASSSPISTSAAIFPTRPAQPLQTHVHQLQAGPNAIVTASSVNNDASIQGEKVSASSTSGKAVGGSTKIGGAGTGAANKARRGLKRL